MAFVVALLLAIFVLHMPWSLVALIVGASIEVAEAGIGIRWTQRRRAQVGAETLIGRTARVVVACAPSGQVTVKGERWQAFCEDSARVGDDVRIERLDGLTLVVERLTKAADVAAAD